MSNAKGPERVQKCTAHVHFASVPVKLTSGRAFIDISTSGWHKGSARFLKTYTYSQVSVVQKLSRLPTNGTTTRTTKLGAVIYMTKLPRY